MPEKKGFWKRLEESKKLQVLFFVVSMAVIVGAYFPLTDIANNMREKRDIEALTISTDYELLYDFESIENVDGIIAFKGWALRLNSKNIGISVVLNATDGSDTKILLAETTEREDVEQYVGETTEFGECGFTADVKENQLVENVCYEIQLALHYEGEADAEGNTDFYRRIATNRYLYDGQVSQYDPTNFEIPQIANAELENVISEGILCTYSMEKRVWIYLYDNQLYCIADFEYWVPLEEVPSVPASFYTLRKDLIPESRKERFELRGYDTIETYPVESDYVSGDSTTYCVTATEVPQEYPITYVRIGTYGNRGTGWIFRGAFMMDTDLLGK